MNRESPGRTFTRGAGPLILSYHGIGGPDGIAPNRFREQLSAILDRRRVISLKEAIPLLGSEEAGQVAVLTFDDGYVDFAEGALPVLESLSLPATLFVPVAFIGQSNSWDRGIRMERRLLDSPSLAALNRESVEVGVHGFSHIRMVGLSQAELDLEVVSAREVLHEIIGYQPATFAYPYGLADDFDEASESAIANAGFICACSARYGRGSDASERFRLKRITVHPTDSLETFKKKVDGRYDWLAGKELVGVTLRRWGLR